MNKTIIFALPFALVLSLSAGSRPPASTDSPAASQAAGWAPATASGPYMGLTPPGLAPAVFAPGLVSTGQDELNASFTPDGKEFYFSIGNPMRAYYAILGMRETGGRWSAPEVLPFSGRFSDADPFVSPDGRRLYFVSRRPLDPSATAEKDWDIWYVERQGDGWGEPKNLGAPVNTPRNEMYVSVTRDGSVYYHSNRPDTLGEMDIYGARLVDGRYQEPENPGPMVNSRVNEWDPFVAPDGSYVIFTSSGRPDDLGRGDMYISFRLPDGSWSRASNMGREVNSPAFDYCPTLSPDGKYLFFSSYRQSPIASPGARRSREQLLQLFSRPMNGLGDVYWVDTEVVERLRPR